jgi:hypothetical protein
LIVASKILNMANTKLQCKTTWILPYSANMSWFRSKSAPKTPEPQQNSYNPPADDYIPDEYERNRRELFAPSGGQGRGPSPQQGYRPPQRNKYDAPDDEEESFRSNVLRKGPPPPSAQAIAREANSVRAMPERYNRSGGPNDAYSRGDRNLEQDRANLFAGATVQPRAGGSSRYDERSGGGAGGEEEEEDLEAIQTKTKDIKQQSVQSTREALRMMREAEETGKNTLLKLGQQSGTCFAYAFGLFG